MAHKQKRRLKKYRPDTPLEIPATVMVQVEKIVASPRVMQLKRAAFSWIPSHEDNKKGRQYARWFRIAIGLLACLCVAKGTEHGAWGGIGISLALTTLMIPISEARKRRILNDTKRHRKNTLRWTPVDAHLLYDGRKISIRAQGRVWRSLRPANPPCDVRVESENETLHIGLVPREGKDRTGMWFTGPTSALPPNAPAACGPEDIPRKGQDSPISLDEDGLRDIHEAFVNPRGYL